MPISSAVDTDEDARALLTPYVDALHATSSTPPAWLFELFYIQHPLSASSPSSSDLADLSAASSTAATVPTQTLFTTPSLPLRGLATAPDAAATTAESLFFDIARSLRSLHPDHAVFAPAEDGEGEKEKDAVEGEMQASVGEVESGVGKDQFAELELRFWPPVPVQDDDDDEF